MPNKQILFISSIFVLIVIASCDEATTTETDTEDDNTTTTELLNHTLAGDLPTALKSTKQLRIGDARLKAAIGRNIARDGYIDLTGGSNNIFSYIFIADSAANYLSYFWTNSGFQSSTIDLDLFKGIIRDETAAAEVGDMIGRLGNLEIDTLTRFYDTPDAMRLALYSDVHGKYKYQSADIDMLLLPAAAADPAAADDVVFRYDTTYFYDSTYAPDTTGAVDSTGFLDSVWVVDTTTTVDTVNLGGYADWIFHFKKGEESEVLWLRSKDARVTRISE
jgi:hypothetical protein